MNPQEATPNTIAQYAQRIRPFSDDADFELPPLIPTVEDALILPRTDQPAEIQIPPPEALPFMTP